MLTIVWFREVELLIDRSQKRVLRGFVGTERRNQRSISIKVTVEPALPSSLSSSWFSGAKPHAPCNHLRVSNPLGPFTAKSTNSLQRDQFYFLQSPCETVEDSTASSIPLDLPYQPEYHTR
jgi:hypothetical protein